MIMNKSILNLNINNSFLGCCNSFLGQARNSNITRLKNEYRHSSIMIPIILLRWRRECKKKNNNALKELCIQYE